MLSADEICSIYEQRRRARGPELARMRDMLQLYNGDLVVPLPELDKNEKAAVVNFAKMGTNAMAQRVASLIPDVKFPAVNNGRKDSARKRADQRRRVSLAWWRESHMSLVLRQRGRWFFAYAESPVAVLPNFDTECPEWEPRSPLETFPAPMRKRNEMVPSDVIFVTPRTVRWITSRYPAAAGSYVKCRPDDRVDVLEYISADEWVSVAQTKTRSQYEIQQHVWYGMDSPTIGQGVVLERAVNRAGVPLCVIPRGMGLERPVGQFDGLMGMYQAQAKLQALGILARTKAVFAEEWLVSEDPNQTPTIDTDADGAAGVVGIVSGGRFDRWTPHPQFATDQSINLLERMQRVEGALPAALGGEAPSNSRTGRSVDSIMQASIDPTLQEAQDIFQLSLEAENRIAVAVDKGWWSGESKSVYISCKGYAGYEGGEGQESYDVDATWETDRNEVLYPFPGADIHSLNIATGQAVALGTMSKRRAAEMNPMVQDVERELDAVTVEKLTEAFLMGIQQQIAAPGGIPLSDLSAIIRKVRNDDMDLIDAWDEAQKAAQERQATQVPPGSPAAQPGMEMPGQGVQSIQGPTPDQSNIAALVSSLTMPQVGRRTAEHA